MLVEITKDARGSKALRQRLIYRLPAGMRRCCRKQIIPAFRVKLPTAPNAAAMKKIADEVSKRGRQARLCALMLPVCRKKFCVLICSSLGQTGRLYRHVAKLARSPQVLHRELDISVRIVRDYLNACIDEVVVDSPAVYGRLQELLQNIAESRSCKLLLHDKQTDIFSYYRLSDDIASISDRRIDFAQRGLPCYRLYGSYDRYRC